MKNFVEIARKESNIDIYTKAFIDNLILAE
jgi:hypothetical protein